jgi:hypothetical protein
MSKQKKTAKKKPTSKKKKISKQEQIIKEIADLIDQGIDILKEVQGKDEISLYILNMKYEPWYTKSLSVVQQLIPERLDDFINAYKCDKRKELSATTYRIFDFLNGIISTYASGKERFDTKSCFNTLMINQISIISSAADNINSRLRDIKGVLKAEMFDSELEAAKELRKNKYIRAAGVLCGVILEEYFNSIAQRRKIKITKRNPTISDYNDAFKKSGVYDVPKWRLIQRLGDIRNYCGHKKEREPTEVEVDDLIIGTEKVIKEVF